MFFSCLNRALWYDAYKYKGGDFMSQTISVSTTMG